jgi:murein DD-endopeptidase MepM/ murein hydrolase activator NlpD
VAEPNTENEEQTPDEAMPFGSNLDVQQSVPGQGPSANMAGPEAPNPPGTAGAGEQVAKQAAKTAAKAGAKATASAIWAFILAYWPIILIAIAVLIAVIVGAIAISDLFMNPNPRGGTMQQPADPVADRDWLRKFLALSGDESIKDNAMGQFVTDMTTALQNINTELTKPENQNIPNRSDIISKLDQINTELGAMASNVTAKKFTDAQTNYTNIKNLSGSIGSLFSAKLTKFSGPHSLPFDAEPNLDGGGLSLHFNSFSWPVDASGHRTFQFFKQNMIDAVDMSTEKNGGKVKAMINGKIREVACPGCTAYFLEGKDNANHNYRITYADVKLLPGVDSNNIKAGQTIAESNQGSKTWVHFEISIDGNPVNFSKADLDGPDCGGPTDMSTGFGMSKKCASGSLNKVYWKYIVQIFGP